MGFLELEDKLLQSGVESEVEQEVQHLHSSKGQTKNKLILFGVATTCVAV